jgi:hypothetical protein
MVICDPKKYIFLGKGSNLIINPRYLSLQSLAVGHCFLRLIPDTQSHMLYIGRVAWIDS